VIGVFDSGVGGLSVLRALRSTLSNAALIYVADSGHAPYGERSDQWLQARCATLADFLRARGADMMVVACNTATAAAVPLLRASHPTWPIVGIEPGIKPAVLNSSSRRVGVMATTATLRSQRFAKLLADHGSGAMVIAQACTGLAMAIEQGDEAAIGALVDQHTQRLREAQVDTVVLGCTHYAFAHRWISQTMGPNVAIIDTAHAVARRASSLLVATAPSPQSDHQLISPPTRAEFWTSSEPAALEHFAERWLGWEIKASRLDDQASARAVAAPDQ
jgi:glutamate racemase